MVRRAERSDLETVAELAVLLWGTHTVRELADDFFEAMEKGGAQFFLKQEGHTPVGFAQCQLRHDYVEGTHTSPVGYLEGIFVKEEYRHRGYAKELLSACEDWARDMGCREFASDCEPGNAGSFRFHMSTGFTEVNRIICFAKKL